MPKRKNRPGKSRSRTLADMEPSQDNPIAVKLLNEIFAAQPETPAKAPVTPSDACRVSGCPCDGFAS